ncbi:MAG TPA: hypothetical protein G4O04_08445 [Anaerolineae bacterium]|nr:hypothetical protein [Anaerolineae bacterium]
MVVASGVTYQPPAADETQGQYTLLVRYKYTVAGQVYESRRLGLSSSAYGNRKDARRVAARSPEGKTVTVHCNPHTPAEAWNLICGRIGRGWRPGWPWPSWGREPSCRGCGPRGGRGR